MILRHLVTIHHADQNGEGPDLTAHVTWLAVDELEVEWTPDSQHVIDGVSRADEKRLEQLATEAWFDVHAKLDQDTESDEAADHQLDLYKERREREMFD